MKRLFGLLVVVVFLVPGLARAQSTPVASPEPTANPPGIPTSATVATVHRVVDGDKVYVRLPDDELDQILLAGVDAPENGECFYAESKEWLTKLLPKGTTVYLERSGTVDRAGHVIVRYVWLPGVDGKKAALVNTKIVREGYGGFDATYDAPKYYDRMKDYDQEAQKQGTGLWGACGGVHEAIPTPTPVPTMTPVPTPTETPKLSPDEQAYIDWLHEETVTVGQSMDDFTDLASNFELTDLLDQNWIIKMAVIAATWQISYDTAVAKVPPPALADVHAAWVSTTAHLANASDYLTYGIDNFDAASLNQAATEISLANDALGPMTDALDQFKRDRGIDSF